MTAAIQSPLDALLVGYEDQENLGLRSILAYLHSRGFRADIAPFRPSSGNDLVALIRDSRPRLVGVSVIFQYTLDSFGQLLRDLRAEGVETHFTAGGHYPTVRPAQMLAILPELDTVVRGEGELTLAELLESLDHPERWSRIQGLAFRRNGDTVLNPPRPLIRNLDDLPLIHRDRPRSGPGIRVASMLASRGCLYNCSFCSIRQFYGASPGPLRRVRSPDSVVGEMTALYHDLGVQMFVFQDDDFAARTERQREWLRAFLQALARAHLVGRIRWKISCRVDDLDPGMLDAMRDHGLIAVYLGVESGSALGLRALNKHVSVAQNEASVDLLKRFDLALAIGFMLFDPSSTISTVRQNIDFLRRVGGDGYFPINFCKMLPYAGTPVEAQLRAEGRLCGTASQPDYAFLDPRLSPHAYLVHRIFSRRNFASDGLVSRLQQADWNQRLAREFGTFDLPSNYRALLERITATSNASALKTLDSLLDEVVQYDTEALAAKKEELAGLAEGEWRAELEAEAELAALQSIAWGARSDSK